MSLPVNTLDDYRAFLASKSLVRPASGIEVTLSDLNPALFPFQKALVQWALRKGRAALFCDTGLGKTIMQLEWARLAGERTLILAPLAVARQTVAEGERFGIPVTYARSEAQMAPIGISIANYEMMDHFDLESLEAIILDESSILKAYTGKTKQKLIERCRGIRMKLCCTATPAPNDTVELCNHADFLELMKPADMLSTFFVSVGKKKEKGSPLKLKAHARKLFYQWLASWAMSLKKPSDIGYSDEGYNLPRLSIQARFVDTDYVPVGQLFFSELKGVTDRARVRRATLPDRVATAVELVEAEPSEKWLLWCGLDDEGRELKKAIPDALLVEGSQSPDEKAQALLSFAEGDARVLITKASIAGYGLNLQACARMAFVGLGDSYEAYYQAIRRCWRYGQTRPVKAHIVLSEPERAVYENVLRKEQEAQTLSRELIQHVAEFERSEIHEIRSEVGAYAGTREMVLPAWLLDAGRAA